MEKILEKLALVPHCPGVYQMLDKSGHVVYIGKAKNLFNRLSSYFKSTSHDAKTTAMLLKVENFEYFICKSENDALGLEANLIKRHKPHYNILLKDNKSFPYIVVGEREIEITRRRGKRGKYFGPYFNGIWARGLLDTLVDTFNIPRSSGSALKADEDTLEKVKKFLGGESDFGAREILGEKMQRASELQQYELAIRYRNGIAFLDKLKERTLTQVGRDVNCDVFGAYAGADIFVVAVITVRSGAVIGVQNYVNQNNSPLDDADKLQEFISQYYLENVRVGDVVTAHDVKIGFKRRLVEMAQQNAREYLETSIERIKYKNQFTVGAVDELRGVLGLTQSPKRIECYDISHSGGEDVVGAMVVFIDGVAEKKLYRKFKLRHGRGNDDYLSMREVIGRRLKRTDWGMPDLIVVDGGKGQLSAVVDLCDSAGVAVIALAKAQEEIFLPNMSESIQLDKRSHALRLLQRLRDEAHRFANEYRKHIKRA